MRVFCLLILFLLLYSCSKKKSDNQFQGSNSESQLIRLNILKSSDVYYGCSENIIDFNDTIGSHNFIFLSNFIDSATVKLNNEKIKLMKDTIESKVINQNDYISVYRKGDCKVILNLSLEKPYDEGGAYHGKMTIIKGRQKIEKKVRGECGC